MKMIVIIIVMQVMVTMLTGCSMFESKMEQMRSEQLTCSPEDSEMCAGWKVGEF
jgi:hypothetical protein